MLGINTYATPTYRESVPRREPKRVYYVYRPPPPLPNIRGARPNVQGARPNVPSGRPNIPSLRPNLPSGLPNLPLGLQNFPSGLQNLPTSLYMRQNSTENILRVPFKIPTIRTTSPVIPKVSSVGEELHHLEKDRSISTDPTESRKRRTIRLIRSNSSWGFTLQTYGIRHKKTNEIEITTYVDYVEIDSPAWIAGMRRGDVILSVNGDSVEQSTHQQLVEKIKACTQNMRLVVLFEDCCRKVELHDRYIKLRNVLKEKKRELRLLEEQERCILQGVTRMDCARLSCRSSASSLDSTFDRYSLIRPSSMGNMPTTSRFPYFRNTDSDTTHSFYSGTSENGSIFGVVGVDLDSEDSHSCASSVISSGVPDCVMPDTPLGGSRSGSSNSVMDNEPRLEVEARDGGAGEFEQNNVYTAAKDSVVGDGLVEQRLWQPGLMRGEEAVVGVPAPPPLLPPPEHINERDEVTRL